MSHIGKNISKIRAVKGFKQSSVAQQLNISQQEYSKIENAADVKSGMLSRIAKVFEVQKEDIINFEDRLILQNHHQQGGVGYNINPIEKIIELYEARLTDKDAIIKSQQIELDRLKKMRAK